jgi:shikimate kinase
LKCSARICRQILAVEQFKSFQVHADSDTNLHGTTSRKIFLLPRHTCGTSLRRQKRKQILYAVKRLFYALNAIEQGSPHVEETAYTMPSPELLAAPQQLLPCLILIGMAGAGKSTVGKEIARLTDWAYLDTDYLLEAAYGAPLQRIADFFDQRTFIKAEGEMICSIKASRTIIATGGSVIYHEDAMRHLTGLGAVVYLDVPFSVIQRRIAAKPDRGLAIAPGQSLWELFQEREPLYKAWAMLHCEVGQKNSGQCARWILEQLKVGTF